MLEVDLDVAFYGRFLDIEMARGSYIPAGRYCGTNRGVNCGNIIADTVDIRFIIDVTYAENGHLLYVYRFVEHLGGGAAASEGAASGK